jgi:hypothetical protein
MKRRNDLLALERAAWEALCEGGDAAVAFYDEVLAKDVLMLFPGGMVIDDRAQVVDSMRGANWRSFDITENHVLDLTPDSAVLAYRVKAQRDGSDDYEALLNSTYVREGDDWKLALHQQTPA